MARVLVFGQFGCIAVLLFGGGWHLPIWAWGIFGLGLLVFVWAAFSLGTRNFTIMPVPREGNRISKQGIYAYLRHPMYTAVLLCGVAVSIGAPSIWRWCALSLCVFVLVLKIRFEERALAQLHPTYPDIMDGVARLIPKVW